MFHQWHLKCKHSNEMNEESPFWYNQGKSDVLFQNVANAVQRTFTKDRAQSFWQNQPRAAFALLMFRTQNEISYIANFLGPCLFKNTTKNKVDIHLLLTPHWQFWHHWGHRQWPGINEDPQTLKCTDCMLRFQFPMRGKRDSSTGTGTQKVNEFLHFIVNVCCPLARKKKEFIGIRDMWCWLLMPVY